MKLKTLLPSLALLLAVGVCAAPLSAQTTGTTQLSLNLAVAGTLQVTGGNVTLTGGTFGPWASPSGATTVTFSYRAGSTASSGVSISVASSAGGGNAMVGASSASNVIPGSDLTFTDTAVSIGDGGNLVASAALGSGATLFTNGKSTHAQNQSFTVGYTVSAGDFAADNYTATLTYTLAVS